MRVPPSKCRKTSKTRQRHHPYPFWLKATAAFCACSPQLPLRRGPSLELALLALNGHGLAETLRWLNQSRASSHAVVCLECLLVLILLGSPDIGQYHVFALECLLVSHAVVWAACCVAVLGSPDIFGGTMADGISNSGPGSGVHEDTIYDAEAPADVGSSSALGANMMSNTSVPIGQQVRSTCVVLPIDERALQQTPNIIRLPDGAVVCEMENGTNTVWNGRPMHCWCRPGLGRDGAHVTLNSCRPIFGQCLIHTRLVHPRRVRTGAFTFNR